MKANRSWVAMGAFTFVLVVAAHSVEAGCASPTSGALLGAKLRQAVAVSDLDGDAVPEVVAADFLSDSVSIWRRDDDGFRQVGHLGAKGGPRSLAVTDFSGDGLPDLAVASFLSGEIRLFAGHGDGSFAEASLVRSMPGLSALIAQDFDGDRNEDLALANVLTGEITFLRGVRGSKFEAPLLVGKVRAAFLLLATDFDTDGTLELIAVGSKAKARAFAVRNGLLSAAGEVGLTVALTAAEDQASAVKRAPSKRRSLRRASGDGQVALAGHSLPEALVAELNTESGRPLEGESLMFWLLARGWHALEPPSFTDEQGRAAARVPLAPMPQSLLVLATALDTEPALFSATGVLPVDKLFDRLQTALRRPGLAASAHAGALLRLADRLLRGQETVRR